MFGIFKRHKKEKGEKFQKPYYSFRSVKAGKVIDVAQDGDSKGALIIWEGYGGQNQSFTMVKKDHGYCIKSKQKGLYLTVEGSGNGARIYAAAKNNQPNQTFQIQEVKEGQKQYAIYTFCGKVLDVFEASKKNGAKVIQWDFNGHDNQLWNFCDPKNITSSSSEIE